MPVVIFRQGNEKYIKCGKTKWLESKPAREAEKGFEDGACQNPTN